MNRVDVASGVAMLARLLADESRAAMALALLDGRAWTATELAVCAGIARSTATEHLNALVAAGLLAERREGRHRYLRLASPDVARLIEVVASHVPPGTPPSTYRAVKLREDLANARSCYDHVAGRLGVAVTSAMIERGYVEAGSQPDLTKAGEQWADGLGIDVSGLRRARRPAVRLCVDWTERREHLAGGLGAAFLDFVIARGWVEPKRDSRALRVTPEGITGLESVLGLRSDVEQ